MRHVACGIATDSAPAAVPHGLVEPSSILQPLRAFRSVVQGLEHSALQRIARAISLWYVALTACGAAVMCHKSNKVGGAWGLNKGTALRCLEMLALCAVERLSTQVRRLVGAEWAGATPLASSRSSRGAGGLDVAGNLVG